MDNLIAQDLDGPEMTTLDEPAFDNIGLQDKQIEPSKYISEYVTRNQSLGNLTDKEFLDAKIVKDEALKLIDMPYKIGGWLGRKVGKNLLARNELTLVMSGSRNGFVREILATRKAFISREEKSKTTRKFGSGIGEM